MRFEVSAVMPEPIERTWEVLLRWEDQSRWLKDADSVRVLTLEREGIGVEIAVQTRVLHVPLFTERLEVVEWDPPRLLTMAHRSFVRGVGTWLLEPDPGGTRFTWTEDLSLPVPLLGALALLVYRPFMRHLMLEGVRSLRRYMLAT
jgi:hypothetical protein